MFFVCMLRLPLSPLSNRVPVVVAAVVFRLHLEGRTVLLLLWYSGFTWREERVGNALDSKRVDIVDADNGLLRSETKKHKLVDWKCN